MFPSHAIIFLDAFPDGHNLDSISAIANNALCTTRSNGAWNYNALHRHALMATAVSDVAKRYLDEDVGQSLIVIETTELNPFLLITIAQQRKKVVWVKSKWEWGFWHLFSEVVEADGSELPPDVFCEYAYINGCIDENEKAYFEKYHGGKKSYKTRCKKMRAHINRLMHTDQLSI